MCSILCKFKFTTTSSICYHLGKNKTVCIFFTLFVFNLQMRKMYKYCAIYSNYYVELSNAIITWQLPNNIYSNKYATEKEHSKMDSVFSVGCLISFCVKLKMVQVRIGWLQSTRKLCPIK
jgi:hypothetical protein